MVKSFAAFVMLTLSSASAFIPARVNNRWTSTVANFKVTLKTGDQVNTLEIPGDQYILEAAEEANVSLPYDCRLGSCVTCGGKIESGTVDQTDQIFLSDELMDQGFALLCVTYATSDCTIETHVKDEIDALL